MMSIVSMLQLKRCRITLLLTQANVQQWERYTDQTRARVSYSHRDQTLSPGEARERYFVACTLSPMPWYEIKDVPIYRCKSFKFRTLGVKFRYIYCS